MSIPSLQAISALRIINAEVPIENIPEPLYDYLAIIKKYISNLKEYIENPNFDSRIFIDMFNLTMCKSRDLQISCFRRAALRNHQTVIKYFIKQNLFIPIGSIDPDKKEPTEKEKFLLDMISLKKLCGYKGLPIIFEKDISDVTFLMYAAAVGRADTIAKFIRKRANVNAIDSQRKNALMYAAKNGHEDTVIELIENKANVNDQNANGKTALMYAAAYGHYKIVEILLLNGGDKNMHDNMGWTALHWASSNNFLRSVAELIKSGASIDEKNNKKNTPLILATMKGNIWIVSFLIEKGANIRKKNHNHKTALLLAKEKHYNEIEEVLTQKKSEKRFNFF